MNLFLFVSTIIVSIYAQTTPSPIHQQEESSDSASTTSEGDQWGLIIIIGVCVILAVIMAADRVHKNFQAKYADLMINIHGTHNRTKQHPSWAQQTHLRSAVTPRKSKPKTTEKKQKKNLEKASTKKDTNDSTTAKKEDTNANKVVVNKETDADTTQNAADTTKKDDDITDDIVYKEDDINEKQDIYSKENEVTDTIKKEDQVTETNNTDIVNKEQLLNNNVDIAITKQVTDVIIAQQATNEEVESNENDSIIVKEDEDINEEHDYIQDRFPDVDVHKMEDVEIVIKKDDEEDIEEDIEIIIKEESDHKIPEPLDDPEIIIKQSENDIIAPSDDSSEEEETETIANNAPHVRRTETPVKETLEAAWNFGDSEDSEDEEENGDVMSDLASVRVEINRRTLQNLAPIHDMETPQSTAL